MSTKNILIIGGMLLILVIFFPSCNLNGDVKDELTSKVLQSDTNLLPNVVAAPLGLLRNLWWRQRVWGFQETTSDECFFPTRGTDWYDGGVWVADYTLTWTPMHRDVVGNWNDLSVALASANTALLNIGVKKANELPVFTNDRAQATFLRSFYEYNMYDLYRTYPSRDPFNSDFAKAPEIYTGVPAFNRLVGIVKANLPDMVKREFALYGEPNQDAGLMLLAKLYLNKGVYTGVPGYDSCLIYLNQIIATGHYALANNYFNMFSVNNDQNYKKADDEAIFVAVFNDDQNYGNDDNVQWVKTTFHYNQNLGSTFSNWNGSCAPQGYLMNTWIAGTDTSTDTRWKDTTFKAAMGVNLGFNYGQQYDPKTHVALKDRNGNPLNFSFDCPLSGAKEYQGVRVLKFPPRIVPVNTARCPNDFLIWRYADALLMKAECLVRTQNDAGVAEALSIVNEIRTKRNAPVITATASADMLNKIYIERGLELYWEGHRRQDMIRFGTFLQPKDSKPDVSPATAILLPIPASAITGTPGGILHQNPGY
jgi:starch-binding outer membrane protein, SusD/RagB family